MVIFCFVFVCVGFYDMGVCLGIIVGRVVGDYLVMVGVGVYVVINWLCWGIGGVV